MPAYKITIGLVQHTIGVTESYITPDVSQTAITGLANDLINLRRNTLYTSARFTEVRISQVVAKRRSAPYPPGSYRPFSPDQILTVPVAGNFREPSGSNRPDQARACLQVRLTFNDDRRVTRYFGLVPDNILYDEDGGSVDFAGNLPWKIAYDIFTKFLIDNRFAIRAQVQPPGIEGVPVPLTDIVEWTRQAAAPNLMGIVVPSLPGPGIDRRQYVRIINTRRRGESRTSYNGRYFVQSVNTTDIANSIIYYLRNTEAGEPLSVKLPGQVFPLKYSQFPIQRWESIRAGIHKRGKPLGSPVGRRASRQSLGL